jgi:MFS family permease
VGHALDHLFLLIFATAVGAIALQWGMLWQDLMPYTSGAFVMFGLGSLPAGRLGDLWGRRAMMIVYFLGMGLSGLVVAVASSPWRLAVALTDHRLPCRGPVGREAPSAGPAASLAGVGGALQEGVDIPENRWQSWVAMNTFLGLLLM